MYTFVFSIECVNMKYKLYIHGWHVCVWIPDHGFYSAQFMKMITEMINMILE